MDSVTLSYATAISSLQKENNVSSKDTINDLEKINSSFDDKIKKFLYSKAINANEKKRILGEALKGFDKNIVSFIYVLIDNNRINKLSDIIIAYKEIVDKELGKIIVNVKVSNKLSDSEKTKLKEAIKNKLFKDDLVYNTIEINEIIDPSIIKGFVVEYQGKVLDASLLNKQESLKEFLEK